ncbi:MAG: THUMP domain-containing protein [Planctomycetales bacterium]
MIESRPLTRFFATSAAGIESVTATELSELGAQNISPVNGGVWFEGDLQTLYRANLWLRTGTRISKLLREFAAINQTMLYSQVRRVRWEDYLDPNKTLAVHATIEGMHRDGPPQRDTRPARRDYRGGDRRSPAPRSAPPKGIHHSQFAALKIKDAIVDRLRREQGARPNIDPHDPDIHILAHFAKGRCLLSIDSTGTSLHERGYRLKSTEAPMRETLAAAIVRLSGWDRTSPLLDPMCGSGTLVIEAALWATGRAPAINRDAFAFQKWPDYDRKFWQELLAEAREKPVPEIGPIFASDRDPNAIEAARANARRAGVEHLIQFEVRDALTLEPPTPQPGTILINPPYGTRLGDEREVGELYQQLGRALKDRFAGWKAHMLFGNLTLARSFPLTADAKHRLYNGGLESRLLRFDL